MAHILVVDDDRDTLEALQLTLQREGYPVLTAASGKKALTHLEREDVAVMLCDVRMPGMDGLALLQRVRQDATSTVVVMISGHTEVTTAVAAMKEGAFDYLLKPLKKDEILRTVRKAQAVRALQMENLTLKRQVREQFDRAQIVGSSPAWRRVCETVEQVAASRATVLISGESGTGKELVAGLLHRLSARADGPFIVLNAAAMPATLLEAELFGYEKGAFTGAAQRKLGHFELANGGTLFLDEIGDMPMEVQVKLLRVIQDGTFQRLGGTRTLQADVRMVAATNKDLLHEVAGGRFRQDLYYRLNVISLSLPPLRQRREDIPLLAAHFLRKYSQENGKNVAAIQQEALRQLQSYAWPGNVRELENAIERAVVLAQETVLTADDLQLRTHDQWSPSSGDYLTISANATMKQAEREIISQALKRHNGNRQAAARQLEIGVSTLYRKLKEYELL